MLNSQFHPHAICHWKQAKHSERERNKTKHYNPLLKHLKSSVENIIKQNIWSTLFSADFLLVIREGEKRTLTKHLISKANLKSQLAILKQPQLCIPAIMMVHFIYTHPHVKACLSQGSNKKARSKRKSAIQLSTAHIHVHISAEQKMLLCVSWDNLVYYFIYMI